MLEPDEARSTARRALSFGLSVLFAAQAVDWCWALASAAPRELSPALSREEAAVRLALTAALGVASYASFSAALALEGLLAGLLFGLLGAQAPLWLRVCQAWAELGWFAGSFLPWLAAPALAATCAAVALTLRHRELRGLRWQLAALALLAWALPPRAAGWHLRRAYDLRAPSLSVDAGLTPAAAAERVSVAWLFPSGGQSVRFEEKQAVAQAVDVSPESLDKLASYLRRRDYRGVFARQAVGALREGWLFWWEPELALDAAMLARPGRLAPDYRLALGLLRAGPIHESRYRRLQQLAELAKARKEGFEDVNTSQLIFEGFASAFARFGDEESARNWLYKIDNLWPIYEKKIEVTPLELSHDGSIGGSVTLDGAPATAFKVGLFYVAASTSPASPHGFLSQSQQPGPEGAFSFGSLAPGAYYLALMGSPADLRGRVLNPPGVVELTAEAPLVRLPPIRVER